MALWLSWGLSWFLLSRGAAEDSFAESASSRFRHLTLMAFGFALLFTAKDVSPALAARLFPRTAVLNAIGQAVTIAGLGVMLWSRRYLGKNWSGTVTLKNDHEIVRSGPYALVRHPIYSGFLLAACGSALIAGSIAGFCGIALFFAAYARKIKIEETVLVKFFGDAYLEYQKTVKAIVPGVY